MVASLTPEHDVHNSVWKHQQSTYLWIATDVTLNQGLASQLPSFTACRRRNGPNITPPYKKTAKKLTLLFSSAAVQSWWRSLLAISAR